jgi:hypothetical protein
MIQVSHGELEKIPTESEVLSGPCLPGSARIPRAGEGLQRSRTSLDFLTAWGNELSRKDRFGATPKPARETRALPNPTWLATESFANQIEHAGGGGARRGDRLGWVFDWLVVS